MHRLNKNKTFIVACIGVGLSAVCQYFILSIMSGNKPIEQAFALFIFDLLLVLVLDAVKKELFYKNPNQ